MDKGICTVITNVPIAERIYKMELEGEIVTQMNQPGQFLHVRVADGIDPLLRRPISISDVDMAHRRLSIIYRVEGKGTHALSQMRAGEPVDVLGPLGKGFPITKRRSGEKVLLVGGGVGVPPLYYLAKELVARGVEVLVVLGFGEAKQVFLAEEFARLGDTVVTTIDGSYGVQGLVTDALEGGFASGFDALYACGPLPMLQALQQRYGDTGTEGYISMEQRMGCGVGACLACVCKPNPVHSERSYYKVCTDGPVFTLEEVLL